MRRRFNLFDFDELFSQMFGADPMKNFDKETKSGSDEDGEWTSESYTSPDGTWKSTVIYKSYFGSPGNHYKSNKTSSSNDLKKLKSQLEDAIEKQEFELAVELRDKIKTLEQNKGKIEELETKLKEAIEKQEFEMAIEIRDEIKKLKS